MKKLTFIMLAILIAITLVNGADRFENFWFNNNLEFSFSDKLNPKNKDSTTGGDFAQISGFLANETFMFGYMENVYAGDTVNINVSILNLAKVQIGYLMFDRMAAIGDVVNFGTTFSFGSIYRLGLGAYGIGVVYLTDILTGDFKLQTFGYGGVVSLDNVFTIPGIMNIQIYHETHVYNNIDNQLFNLLSIPNSTKINLAFKLALSGLYPFGFSWAVSELFLLGLDVKNYLGANGGTFISNEIDTWYYGRMPFFDTRLTLTQNILKPFAIENVQLNIMAMEMLLIHTPFNGGAEQNTIIQTQGKYGLNVVISGFSIGLYMLSATQDTYNTSVPYDGSLDSTKSYYDASPARPAGRGQLGVMVDFGYTSKKGLIKFKMSYSGLAQIRDYDANKDNFSSIENSSYAANSRATQANGGVGIFYDFYGYSQWANMIYTSLSISW